MIVILFGPPGSGKGTQAELLKERYGLKHLSTGDMLRREVQEDTAIGKAIKESMDKGQYVSDELMLEIIIKTLSSMDYHQGCILDGFPRTVPQAESLDIILEKMKQKVDHVIEIVIDRSILLKRTAGRFSCAACGTSYNDYFHSPTEKGVCDICGKKTFKKRTDDAPETVEKRLEVYTKQTEPILPFYEFKGVLERVDGTKGVQEVATQIIDIIERSK